MIITKVTRKFQITIPKAARDKLGIKIGDELIVEVEGDKIVLRPLRRTVNNPLEELLNIFKENIDIDAVKLVESSWDED